MNQIEKAISNLSSPDKDTRYKACVELRVADSLPEPAIAALEAVTNDPDPLVAEAARQVLASHKPSPPTEEPISDSHDLPLQETPRRRISGWAIASFTLGVLGFIGVIGVLGLILGSLFFDDVDTAGIGDVFLWGTISLILPMGLGAFIVGAIAILMIKKKGTKERGYGLAIV